ncbi:MAG: hypothetical protein P4L72_15815 [Parvibaculum sp.]|uniref:hypothetical protein n=1 Tax=Parvibaculum sp. TaxID=2024848 RepID=UPI0028463F38|nr:hypothetical protein [Parvibaculum sp.]MDR3500681.1 hypothetical protein [Parvibaculum sp.]
MSERPSLQPSLLVSAVEDDGTIVETVFRPEAADTALVVARGNEIEIVREVKLRDTLFVPVRASNNLIKHNAVLLPSAPSEYGTVEELLAEIEVYIRRYVSLTDQAAGMCAVYVLLSWVYDAFNELPYLRFRGDYGTGKTRALLVVGSLCYKAFFASGASTVSPIFHTLDTFKGTLIFDEADFRFSDEKAELVKILNNGNAKGFPVLRTQVTQKKEFDPQAFTIFGPKIVGMRRAYDDRALESRFLTIDMQPGRADGVPINLPDGQKAEALDLRNKLLMYRLRNRLVVSLDASLADPALEPRMNQILLPLLSVVPDDALRAVIRAKASALQSGLLSERLASSEGQVLTILHRLAAERPDPTISVAAITSAFSAAYGNEYERPISNRWIGSILRRLGIGLYKSNGVFVLVPRQEEHIGALCTRYGAISAIV